MHLQFVFDYRSPYSYLASTRLPTLNHPVDFLPVDVLAVMKAVNNQPSPACPAKAKYSGIDARRWATLYEVPLQPNAAFFRALRSGEFEGPLLSRLAVAAQQEAVFERLHAALFEAVWAGDADLLSPEGRSHFLRQQGIDLDLWQLADTPAIRERLDANDAEAVSRGVFGVPTFRCDEELFFGNDRLDFVRAALKHAEIN